MCAAPQFDWTNLAKLLSLCIEFAANKHEGGHLDSREVASRIANELDVDDIVTNASDAFGELIEEGVGLAFENADAVAIAAVFAKERFGKEPSDVLLEESIRTRQSPEPNAPLRRRVILGV